LREENKKRGNTKARRGVGKEDKLRGAQKPRPRSFPSHSTNRVTRTKQERVVGEHRKSKLSITAKGLNGDCVFSRLKKGSTSFERDLCLGRPSTSKGENARWEGNVRAITKTDTWVRVLPNRRKGASLCKQGKRDVTLEVNEGRAKRLRGKSGRIAIWKGHRCSEKTLMSRG